MAPKGNILRTIIVSAVVILVANLGFIIYHFFFSDMHYFNKEHLIEGGVFTLVTAFLLFMLAIHANKLRQNEERLRSIFEASSDFIHILDLHGKIIQTNQAAIDKSGYSKDEFVDHSIYEFFTPSSQNIFKEQFPVLLKEGHNRVEIEFIRKDGTIINMDCSASAVHDNEGNITSFMVIQRDISKRKNAEKALKESESLYRSLIEISPDAIVLLDLDANIMMINRQAMVLFERNSEDMIGKSGFVFILPNELARAKENLHSILAIGNVRNLNHTIMKKDGACFPSELSASLIRDADGKPIGIIVILRDITEKTKFEQERKKLDERLFMEQKESSILTLAGGIAHDFNNLLMSVVGNAELLKMKVSLKNNEEEFLQNIIASSERMADLTRQLLAYAKGGMYQQKIVSINSLIQEALDLTHKAEALVIETRLDLSEDLWPVLADQGQMKQVFMNLFTNAFEAMEKGGGCLSVQTSNVVNKDAWECSMFRHEHPSGDYVYIRIADTGHGISEENLKKLFDPFFTTKFMGRGLGLAAAAGIIQNHNGCISVESKINQGSVFHVYLPGAEATSKVAKEKMSPEKSTIGNKILVVDDELQILELMEDMLLRMGYQVLKATSGSKALEIFRNEKDNIRMAIIDILMPGMDGRSLFKALKDVNSDLKVLISSGYDETTALEGMAPYRPEGYIQKPYRFNALKEKLREILKD